MTAQLRIEPLEELPPRAGSLHCTESDSGEHLSAQAREVFQRDVLSGLLAARKTLPCKYFYDTRGSRLFERICETPEYYVTRTEIALLRKACPQVAELIGKGADVLEPGSGAGEKIRILLDSLLEPRSFTPIDISKSAVKKSTEALARDYPHVEVHPLVADFTRPFRIPPHFFEDESPERDASSDVPPKMTEHRRVIFFPGSTISNFDLEDAAPFLRVLQGVLKPKDFLFIGVDRIKDKSVLESAYDDAQGVTAEFNLNLLHRIVHELDTDLDPENFSHRAHYHESLCRIEMHLVAKVDHTVNLCGQAIRFQRGETIHTENSYKYSVQGFSKLARQAGFEVIRTFSDERDFFNLFLCQVPG